MVNATLTEYLEEAKLVRRSVIKVDQTKKKEGFYVSHEGEFDQLVLCKYKTRYLDIWCRRCEEM